MAPEIQYLTLRHAKHQLTELGRKPSSIHLQIGSHIIGSDLFRSWSELASSFPQRLKTQIKEEKSTFSSTFNIHLEGPADLILTCLEGLPDVE